MKNKTKYIRLNAINRTIDRFNLKNQKNNLINFSMKVYFDKKHLTNSIQKILC